MKFGQNAEEAAADTRQSTGGAFIRYPKDGDLKIRILQEPSEWVYWWEHFQPGASFPCNNEVSCPGCNSTDEKVKKVSRKGGFNVLDGEYVNVYAFPPLAYDKLLLRFSRLGTLLDRDYLITRYKTGAGDRKKTEYDIESLGEKVIDLSEYKDQMMNIHELLEASWNETWGDSGRVRDADAKNAEAQLRTRLAEQSEDPPSEPVAERNLQAAGADVEISESELRKMGVKELKILCVTHLDQMPPSELKTPGKIVDWMLERV